MSGNTIDPRTRIRRTDEWQRYIEAEAAMREARKELYKLPLFSQSTKCPRVREICEDVVNALSWIGDLLLDVRATLQSHGEGDKPLVLDAITAAEELRTVGAGKCSGIVVIGEDLGGKTCNESLLKLNEWIRNCVDVL